MQVRDVMRTPPEPLGGAETVQTAAERMKREDLGCLLVGDARHLEGIVTDRDLSLRCLALGRQTASTPVRDVMSVGVIACREDESIGDVVERMTERGLLRLPVVDRRGCVVGVISARDSVRSVPMAQVARSKPTEVRFSKAIPTSQGQVRHVPVQSVYVTDPADDQHAEREAIERFQSEHGVSDWRLVADDLEIMPSA